jgi:hypothetical protein
MSVLVSKPDLSGRILLSLTSDGETSYYLVDQDLVSTRKGRFIVETEWACPTAGQYVITPSGLFKATGSEAASMVVRYVTEDGA